jgi:glucosamine-6-phosphate deaminase
MNKVFKSDKLKIKIFKTREVMGLEAAKEAARVIRTMLGEKDYLNIIFAAAPSQNDFLSSLIKKKNIEWNRIRAFHMDEYIGLSKDAPQGFGNFLKATIYDKVPFKDVFYLHDERLNADANCARYESLLEMYPVDLVFMGIGENGHIAFNDPHVAHFDDFKNVKVVDLDLICRIQQVNDGCFQKLEDVPTHAITLTIPALMRGKKMFCMVPTDRKDIAVKLTVEGSINESCPASVLRQHPDATLFLDRDSAALLNVKIYEYE